MAEEAKEKPQQPEPKPKPTQKPLVFISHDSRDAELAEAFSKLLASVSAGMLKSFRSSDKRGAEGIEFGDEWYKQLMEKLESASDVVCLLTERSFKRPWILYEAGVAKGRLDKPVFGVALGISLSKVSVGPFYQFQNCGDNEDSLKKLIMQLAGRVPGLDPDDDVVEAQVKAFKTKVDEILSQLGDVAEEEETPSESSTARVVEELKAIVRDLPDRMEGRFYNYIPKLPDQGRRLRRYNIKVLNTILELYPRSAEDPVSILLIASLLRNDLPWVEVLAREAYDAACSDDPARKERIRSAMHNVKSLFKYELMPGGEEFSEEYGFALRETYLFLVDLATPML